MALSLCIDEKTPCFKPRNMGHPRVSAAGVIAECESCVFCVTNDKLKLAQCRSLGRLDGVLYEHGKSTTLRQNEIVSESGIWEPTIRRMR